MSKPDYGLVEEVLLPWHFTFMSQYTAGSFGSWAGNATLHALYEDMAIANGQIRYHP
jgi:hypothetical protein